MIAKERQEEIRRLSAVNLRFGSFEVDVRNRQLWNGTALVKLQEKPFQILEVLLERPGELITREELVRRLWPDLNVNFDRSLNTAVNVLRAALGDSSRTCLFIETRSGLGYRFVAEVEQVSGHTFGQTSNPHAVLNGLHPADRSAHEDYLKGRHFCERMSEDDLRKSAAHFQSAIDQDPTYAPAYAGLADSYTLFAFMGMLGPVPAGRRAKDLAARSLELDPTLPDAHAAVASVKASFDWDWAGAETEYLRALELNPDYADGYRRYAALLSRVGRTSEAIKQIQRAQALSPISLATYAEAAWILCMARDYERAIEQCWKALEIERQFAFAQYTLGFAYQRLGMTEEALIEFGNARTCSGNNPAMACGLAHAYAVAGMRDEAMTILCELEEMSRNRYVSAYWKSLVWIGLGAHDRALDELENAYEQRDVWLTWLDADPRFHAIRSHAQFWRVLNMARLTSEHFRGYANN